MNDKTPHWLAHAREIYSLAQAGLAYSKNEFDLERYHRLQEICAEIIASHSRLEQEVILKSFSMQAGYATPKIDVRGAVIRDGKILLVQEVTDKHWALPGGWGDLGFSPSEMVEREVLEESGFQVKASKVLAIYDANRLDPLEFYHAYKIIFLCEIMGGEATTSMETPAVGFFSPGKIPPLSVHRTSPKMIDEVFAHLAEPTRPTTFD